MQIELVEKIRGFRGLLVEDGVVFGVSGNWLTSFAPPFRKSDRLAKLPGALGAFSGFQLFNRLVRFAPYRMLRTMKGALIATSRMGILRLGAGEFEFQRVFSRFNGRRPISLCSDSNGYIYFGEYFSNKRRGPVRVFVSRDDGLNWSVCHTFPAKSIRHVHGLEYDAFRDGIWVYTGDLDSECQIGFARSGFSNYRRVLEGSQQVRVCSGIPSPDGLYFGTDAPHEKNHLYLLRDDGSVQHLAEVEHSVFFSGRACGVKWFTTIVEPSLVNTTRSVHVWASNNSEAWANVESFPMDGLPPKLFQYPSSFIAQGPLDCNYLFLSCQGTIGTDGHCLVYRLK